MGRTGRGDSERRLLAAARAMVAERGLAGLRLRAVASRAGANLGLFHYHFGSKREFTRRLLQDIYEEFFGRLRLESQGGGDARRRLRGALVVFGRFARDNRRLMAALFSEVLRGDKECSAFFAANFPRHIVVVARLIAEGLEAGLLEDMPAPLAVSFALGGMGMPNLAVTMLERMGGRAAAASGRFKAALLTDAAIERRADLILKALSARRRR